MYEHKLRIGMGQVDAAGVVFAPRLLEMAHAVYEAFLVTHGWSARHILDGGWALPIVHMEADFHKPIHLDDEVSVLMGLVTLGESSLTLEYSFFRNGELTASAKSVHVAIWNGVKRPLPEALADLFVQE
ncbi:MAG: acyl-CoA thioesterase [Sedimenticola sp.]